MNELFLIITLLVSFGGTILFLKVFGKGGLFAWVGIATVFANIEVTIVVHAFGMDQTLGNTLFAATFLATDILSRSWCSSTALITAARNTRNSIFSLGFLLGSRRFFPVFVDIAQLLCLPDPLIPSKGFS